MASSGSTGTDRRSYAIVHGPNLNLLGTREPQLYGTLSLDEINRQLAELAEQLGVAVTFFQSNHEGQLIDHIQGLAGRCNGIVINAAGFTHTSVSLADALRAVDLPYVEVHLSNVAARESFRHRSMIAAHAVGVVSGFGALSYHLALRALVGRD